MRVLLGFHVFGLTFLAIRDRTDRGQIYKQNLLHCPAPPCPIPITGLDKDGIFQMILGWGRDKANSHYNKYEL